MRAVDPPGEVRIVVPVRETEGGALRIAAPGGREYPVFQPAEHSPLVRRIQDVLATTFAAQVLRLRSCVRNLLLKEPREGAGLGNEPPYLLLSDEGGGFARSGFWMQEAGRIRRMVHAAYVDLVVDDASVECGNFEEIFPHELAHTMLDELAGPYDTGPSRKMHMSMTVTDYPTAFAEGFAEHFQPLVRDHTRNPRLLRSVQGAVPADLDSTWHSRIDQQLRTDGVKQNLFSYRKALPDSALNPDSDPYQVYLDGETSTAFLPGALKTGQEMMACEGLIATLFYRIVNDQRLRDRYREPEFYQRFLPSGHAVVAGRHIFSPYENINLKLFSALHGSPAEPLEPHCSPMVDLLRKYADQFPDESETLFEVFLRTTSGATVSQELARGLELLALTGRLGDLAGFRKLLPSTSRLLDEILKELVAGKLPLDGNLGPELWILNPDFKIARAVWEPARNLPLSLNLNTACEAELLTLPGVGLDLARRIVKVRSTVGFYRDLNDLFRSADLPPALRYSLAAMSEHMNRAGSYQRR